VGNRKNEQDIQDSKHRNTDQRGNWQSDAGRLALLCISSSKTAIRWLWNELGPHKILQLTVINLEDRETQDDTSNDHNNSSGEGGDDDDNAPLAAPQD
jgi:hypothetical protein